MLKKKSVKILLLLIGAAIFVFLVCFKLNFAVLFSTISSNISWEFYAFISLMIALQLVFRSTRFSLLFNNTFEEKISLKKSFVLTGTSFFVAIITPNKLGDITRGLFFREKATEITAITLIEYIFDTLILTVAATIGLIALTDRGASTILAICAIATATLATVFYLIKRLGAIKFVNKTSWYRKISGWVNSLKSHLRTTLKNKFALFTTFILSCCFVMTYFFIFHIVLRRLDAETAFLDVCFCAGAGMFLGSVTFIPMGIGTRDASTYGLLCSIGTEAEIALSAVVIMRSLSMTLILVSGACYFLAVNSYVPKKQRD